MTQDERREVELRSSAPNGTSIARSDAARLEEAATANHAMHEHSAQQLTGWRASKICGNAGATEAAEREYEAFILKYPRNRTIRAE